MWRTQDAPVRLFFDRELLDYPPDAAPDQERWTTLAEVEGSAGETLTWQHRGFFEASRQEDGITIEPEAAQRLMDSLWDCGLRPSQGKGSAGAMAATERHLEDMRRLVFKGQ